MLNRLVSVNLSLSSACGAACIFCPSDRGATGRTKVMDFHTATTIIDEVTSQNFISMYGTERIQVGENGDCFINRFAIDILRYIKATHSGLKVYVWTDAQFLSEEKLLTILEEELVHFIGFNIDGATNRSFRSVKRLDSHYAESLLRQLHRLRSGMTRYPPIIVEALTMRHYVDAVRQHLGRDPLRVPVTALDMEDDFEEIKDFVRPLLLQGDWFGRSDPVFWAERSGVDPANLDYSLYECPKLTRVLTESFIAPNGDWYACCLDSKNELVLGNVLTNSIHNIAQGEARIRLCELLMDRRFSEIGGPCSTVNCCQFGLSKPNARSI